jgi:hypothetical protein
MRNGWLILFQFVFAGLLGLWRHEWYTDRATQRYGWDGIVDDL